MVSYDGLVVLGFGFSVTFGFVSRENLTSVFVDVKVGIVAAHIGIAVVGRPVVRMRRRDLLGALAITFGGLLA
jgi:hypothetical protein